MKAYLLGIVSLAAVMGTGYAQQPSGLLFNQYNFTHTDLFRLSESGSQFATARVAGMGGAFTSLGADVSSMHINPAGLGMYQGSDFSITPMFTTSNITSKNRDGYIYNGNNNKGRFALGNIGAAMNVYEGKGALTSFTLGIGFNRLADFNTNNYMDLGTKTNVTIAQAFKHQLQGYNASQLDGARYGDFPIDRWGALMAYNNYMLEEGAPGRYYVSDRIGGATDILHEARIATKGSLTEYNISGGFNFQNKFYLGFSVGIQDFNYRRSVYYGETYDNNNGSYPLANWMDYEQYTKISGSGANFKLGMIYRPVDALRIGFAVHTPTWSTITDTYQSHLVNSYEEKNHYQNSTLLEDEFDFSTPARILGGVSYTFGNIGVLSLDYERVWYNSMRYRDEGIYDARYKSEFNATVKREFKPTNIIRIGGELRPTGLLSLRAGFAYSTSPTAIDLKNFVYDSPVTKQYFNVTAGLGYRIGRYATLDVAYVYNRTKFHDYYIAKLDGAGSDNFIIGNPDQRLTRHTALMTLGIRF